MAYYYYGIVLFGYVVVPRIRRLEFRLYVFRKMIMPGAGVVGFVLESHGSETKPDAYVLIHVFAQNAVRQML